MYIFMLFSATVFGAIIISNCQSVPYEFMLFIDTVDSGYLEVQTL